MGDEERQNKQNKQIDENTNELLQKGGVGQEMSIRQNKQK